MLRKLYIVFLLVFVAFVSEAQPPTVHASSLTFSNVYCNELVLGWSNGDGDKRIVLAREASAVDTTPSDYQTYTPNSVYGDASSRIKKSYIVYTGTGTSVKVTGLKKGTRYHFAVFEYNEASGGNQYYTSSGYATSSVVTKGITANFTINTKYQCLSGNDYIFTNTSSNERGTSMTYIWDYGDASTKETTTNGRHTYTEGGIFKVKLTAMSTGCTTDTAIQDTVVVPYNLDFALDDMISMNDSIQCFTGRNRFDILNLSLPPDKPIYGQTDRTRSFWTTSQGHKGSAYDFDFVSKTPGQIKVKLVMGRLLNIGRQYCYDSIEKTFVLLPPVVDSSTVRLSDTVMCLENNSFTFTAQGTDIVSTNWNFGDGTTSSLNPATHSYAQTGLYEFNVTVDDINGCTGTFSDTVEVIAIPDNYFSGLKDKYCQDFLDTSTLTPNLTGGWFQGSLLPGTEKFVPKVLGEHVISYIYEDRGCRDTFTDTTEVLARPSFNIGPDTVICPGTTIDLTVSVAGLNYSWDDASTNQTRTVNGPGTYWVRADNGECDSRDTISIIQVVLPTLELGPDTTICGGEDLTYNIYSDAGSIIWSDGSTEGFRRTISQSGTYWAVINHPCGILSDTINVSILPTACEMFIPNAFSPNGDDLNETFFPVGLFRFTSMTIFNEYGMQLYHTTTEGQGWDGTAGGELCPTGIYYYVIHYLLPEEGTYVKKMASGLIYLSY